ncbi:MAG TPA: hypothetical protein VEM32_06870, partial [Geobacteraceae bacterium]|nr:hypothetical protein [Geobacteraceae bacterium]
MSGAVATVTITTYKDGSQWVNKRAIDKKSIDREELASKISDIIGAGAPGIVRVKSGVDMPFVEGRVALQHIGSKEDFYNSPAGKRIGLLDILIGNVDRNPGNWIISPDGTPIPIDHGNTFPLWSEIEAGNEDSDEGEVPELNSPFVIDSNDDFRIEPKDFPQLDTWAQQLKELRTTLNPYQRKLLTGTLTALADWEDGKRPWDLMFSESEEEGEEEHAWVEPKRPRHPTHTPDAAHRDRLHLIGLRWDRKEANWVNKGNNWRWSSTKQDYVEEEGPQGAALPPEDRGLLKDRAVARAKYPAGHPERLKAERAVRQARKAAQTGKEEQISLPGRPRIAYGDLKRADPARLDLALSLQREKLPDLAGVKQVSVVPGLVTRGGENGHWSTPDRAISLDPRIFTPGAADWHRRAEQSGYHPRTLADPVEYEVAHELGHALEAKL